MVVALQRVTRYVRRSSVFPAWFRWDGLALFGFPFGLGSNLPASRGRGRTGGLVAGGAGP
jgi:hypothetical protein